MHLTWTSRLVAGIAATGLALTLAAPVSAADEPDDAGIDPAAFGPKNVIFLIGDGMGFNQIDTASLYEHGVAYNQVAVDPATGDIERQPGRATQVYQHFPVGVAAATFQDGAYYDPAVEWGSFGGPLRNKPDSAATATALATGVRTYNAAIGVDPDGKPVRNLTERAQELGKASGVVTSVPFTHATPASFVAHNAHRNNYHSIAREMVWEHDINVIMGGGHPYYGHDAQRLDEPNYQYVAEPEYRALADGETQFELVETPAEFNALATAHTTPEHVFGLPRVAATLQYERSGPDRTDAGAPVPGAQPYVAEKNTGVPTLTEMTKAALNVLDNASDEGMFLMVEGGAIDWASHANELNRQIEEQISFNQTIETVVDWVERESSWSETLVMVTADHETGYLTSTDSDPGWAPINGEKGELPEATWHTGGHTNALVPVYAKGVGAARIEHHARHEDPVRGDYLENIDIAEAVFDFWGRP
ncbi:MULTISPECIES: alkaline phosphatase [unclassified Streptomyces]|uniref:alkaline phosphatase n=1 Tax=unclassified Streptomyces TaxID=2593676 RepID=UPI000CD52490|nr:MULTISPECIES: alkaline phosphatase [unclassified Streptomyces]